jgi:hypothetical protein
MYLSPLTWGTNDILADFHDIRSGGDSQVKSNTTNWKAKQRLLAKKRNEEPEFVKLLCKITNLHFPAPYLPNPLAAPHSKLGAYIKNKFTWETFPHDVDIGNSGTCCCIMFLTCWWLLQYKSI